MVKRELNPVYVSTIALFVVGLIFNSISVGALEQPLRVVFQSVTGRVLFDHQTHLGKDAKRFSCRDCHHHPMQGADTRGCGVCHSPPPEGKIAPGACFDCHEADAIKELQMTKRPDAFHALCINCHKKKEAGPVECSGCHAGFTLNNTK
jgi:predicted CXXCH cytochrome family protein